MANFCGSCGTRLNNSEMFCPVCGQKAIPAVQSRYGLPTQRKKTTVTNVLIIILTITLLVNGTITGLWYPGFFRPSEEKNDDTNIIEDTGNKTDDQIGDAFQKLGKTSDISIVYTDEERDNSPSSEVMVSPENHSVHCGNISVDFSFNLRDEDKLIVRTLPERTDSTAGYRVKGYDFSLSSGQNEFPVDVVLTVPKTEDDNESTYWASYNEETKSWERIYSELSEDGKNYLVYTNHFSDKAKISITNELYEKIMGVFNGDKNAAKKSAKDLRGLFYYRNEISNSTKSDYVYMFSAEEFIRYMDEQSISTLDELDEIINKTPEDRVAYSPPMKPLFGYNNEQAVGISEADVATNIGGLVKQGADQLVKVGQLTGKTGKAIETVGKTAGFVGAGAKVIGPLAFLWSGITLGKKVTNEAAQGKNTFQAFDNHKLETLSLLVGGTGIIAGAASAPFVAAGCAIAGIGLYIACSVNDSVRDLTVNEQVYREYYTPEYGNPRTFYYMSLPEDIEPNKKVGVIKKISALSSDEDALLSKTINKLYGLRGYNTRGIAADAEKYKSNSFNMEWTLVLHTLYSICENQPDKLTKIVKEFYTNYANACFDDGGKTYKELNESYRKQKNYSSDFVYKTLEGDKQNYISNYTSEMMKCHAPLINDLNDTFLNKAKAGFSELATEELRDLMNTRMEFRVFDEAVGTSNRDFFRSTYAVDYHSIEGNSGAEKTGLKSYNLPMRFENSLNPVNGPIFLPNIKSGDKIHRASTYDYFKYSDNLIPRYIASRNNVVFSCTFYHYLLMGAPDSMVFRDVKDKDAKDITEFFDLPMPDKTGVIRVNITVKGHKPTDKSNHSLYITGARSSITSGHSSVLDIDHYNNAKANVLIDNDLNVSIQIPSLNRDHYDEIYDDDESYHVMSISGLTINGKADKYAKDSFDIDGNWTCYADLSNVKISFKKDWYEKNKISIKSISDITVNCQAEIKCSNSHGDIEIRLTLPECDEVTKETDYFYSKYGPPQEKKTTKSKVSISWTLSNKIE